MEHYIPLSLLHANRYVDSRILEDLYVRLYVSSCTMYVSQFWIWKLYEKLNIQWLIFPSTTYYLMLGKYLNPNEKPCIFVWVFLNCCDNKMFQSPNIIPIIQLLGKYLKSNEKQCLFVWIFLNSWDNKLFQSPILSQ